MSNLQRIDELRPWAPRDALVMNFDAYEMHYIIGARHAREHGFISKKHRAALIANNAILDMMEYKHGLERYIKPRR